jgi:hypothetical protein
LTVAILNAKVRNAATQNAATQIAEIQIAETQTAETQIAETQIAVIHGVALSAAPPSAVIQISFPVVIRVARISVQNEARTAVSLPASLVHGAPHEVSRVAAP